MVVGHGGGGCIHLGAERLPGVDRLSSGSEQWHMDCLLHASLHLY
jgi:hypothetical protein